MKAAPQGNIDSLAIPLVSVINLITMIVQHFHSGPLYSPKLMGSWSLLAFSSKSSLSISHYQLIIIAPHTLSYTFIVCHSKAIDQLHPRSPTWIIFEGTFSAIH